MSRGVTSGRFWCALPLLLLPYGFSSASGAVEPARVPRNAVAPDSSQSAGDTAAVHIVVDTLAVDGKGTRLIGTDEADLLPGSAGVLEKSITLLGRGTVRRQDTVRLKARVTPLPSPPPEAACAVQLDIETVSGPAAPAGRGRAPSPETMTATLTLQPGEERLVEAYASTVTEGRVALKLRCGPASPEASEDGEARLVTLNVSIERTAEGEPPELLRNQILTAALARSAVTVASANRPLSDGPGGERRFRRESLEVTLSPILVVAGRLQVEVRVAGEVATIAASEEPVRHPVEASETFVVGPGEPRHLEIEIPSGGPGEGWSRVRFHIQVTGRF